MSYCCALSPSHAIKLYQDLTCCAPKVLDQGSVSLLYKFIFSDVVLHIMSTKSAQAPKSLRIGRGSLFTAPVIGKETEFPAGRKQLEGLCLPSQSWKVCVHFFSEHLLSQNFGDPLFLFSIMEQSRYCHVLIHFSKHSSPGNIKLLFPRVFGGHWAKCPPVPTGSCSQVRVGSLCLCIGFFRDAAI